MPNHFHFVIRQEGTVAISKLMGKVCTSYAMYFNRKYDRTGSLFQSKFRAVHVRTTEQLLWLSAYVHQNPQVAGLVGELVDWKWSSFLDYAGYRNGTLCVPGMELVLRSFPSQRAYVQFVSGSYDKIHERKDVVRIMLDDQ